MSKKLEKRAARLVRKAEHRILAIRRVVRKYNEALQTPTSQMDRELERAVGKCNQIHKALRRVRKKIELKRNMPRRPPLRRQVR
jgi:hypothetical protein